MLNVETQSRESERTGICQRQLDGYYVRLVNSALNGEPFIYTRKGKEYNVLGELGKVGREYAKGGDEEKARTISNFLKIRELSDSLEVTSTLTKSYRGKIIVDEKGNKWGVGFKVNEGGHPVDSYGRPIDLTRVEKLYFPGVDYSSKIDKVLEGKDSTFNVDDKESRVKARKDVWKSSMLTKAGNLISDGEIEIGKKYSERDGDYGKGEKEFYAAAREFEAVGDKKSSTVLYARALACRMMKQGDYKSALHTLKTAGDKSYEAAFSELVKREELKDAKKFEETIEKMGLPEEPYIEKERVIEKKEPVYKEIKGKPAFLDFKRSETVKLGKKIGNDISNVYKAAVSGEGKEPWETEIVKKTVSPFKKGYKSYRGFIDKVVIEGGDRLGDKLYSIEIEIDLEGIKTMVSKEGNPLETEIVRKAVSPFKKGYQFYKGFIDKGIEKGDQLGEKIGVKI